MIREISVETKKKNELIDITPEIEKNLEKVDEGILQVFVPHTTAAVTINENADPDVKRDILKKLGEIVPENDDYLHAEGNSDGHIKSTIVGVSETLIVKNSKVLLGTWQSIFFCEFDGPRKRKIILKY